MDEVWRGLLSRKRVWSLGTAMAGRSLQTFVPFHDMFAVGVPPTPIRNLEVDFPVQKS